MYDSWTDCELESIKRAESLEELSEIALQKLEDIAVYYEFVTLICGPMSTGGLECLQQNMLRFAFAILRAREHGQIVFDQTPLQMATKRISMHHRGGPYDKKILTGIFEPVLASGNVTLTLFLPSWSGSIGSSWERQTAKKYNVQRREYPIAWIF